MAERGGQPLREQIEELMKMGPLPSSDTALRENQEERIKRYGTLISSITTPITDEEARGLVRIFGPDDCFEMAETLVHLIETAPGWPLWECLEDTSNEWVQTLRLRLENAGISPP
jgi:hypothetical protein